MSQNQNLEKYTNQLILVDYIPAQVSFKKICRIYYYAKNPETEKLERIVIKCNTIKNKNERLKYAKVICDTINKKLREGWNPFIESYTKRGYITIDKALETFRNATKNLRKDSLRSYKSFLEYFERYLKEKNMSATYCFMFTDVHAAELMEKIEAKNVGARTYNNYLQFYTSLFLFFQRKKYIKENPFDGFKQKRPGQKNRTIIPKETRKEIKKYLFDNNMIEFYYICQLCYRLFLRDKEILELKIADIDYKNNLISVTTDVAKNHNERTIAVPDEIMRFLRTIKGYSSDWYIFSNGYRPGTTLKNTRDIGRTWANIRDTLQFSKKYQFYGLKDTGITEMLDSGVPAKIVQNLADHSSLDMTAKYSHVAAAKEILKHNNLEF